MPDFVWIAIIIVATIVIAWIMWLVTRRGGRLKFRDYTIVVGDDVGSSKASPLRDALEHVEHHVPELQHRWWRMYLHAVKQRGCDPERLGEYEDSRFMKVLLRYVVSGGNGSRSVQKIVESAIVLMYRDPGYIEDGIEAFIANDIWPSVLRTVKDSLNSEYDSEVLSEDGTTRKRIVSSVDTVMLFDSDIGLSEFIEIVTPVLKNAQRLFTHRRKDDA